MHIMKENKYSLIWLAIVFLGLFMAVQRVGNVYLLLFYFYFGIGILYWYLSATKIVSWKSRNLFLLLLFFWFQEFGLAQDNRILRYTIYTTEFLLIVYLFGYAIVHRKRINRWRIQITTITAIALVTIDLIGTLITYKNPVIFVLSAYDSCKYFALIYYILAIQPSKEDFGGLLKLLSGLIIISTFCAVLQFTGVVSFFDYFRGRYSIYKRFGNFRAIGIFPHGIELGNYSCVLFAIYYNFSKLTKGREKKFLYLMLICLGICIITSGTRTAIVNAAAVLIVSNLGNMKQWYQIPLLFVIVLLIGSNYIDFSSMISRTKTDVNTELPRSYYTSIGIDIWKDHPLFGIGFSTYGSEKYRARTNDLIFNEYNAHAFDYAGLATADSFLAEVLPEFGILGILTWGLYGVFIFKQYKKRLDYKSINYVYVSCILSILILAINTSSAFISPHIGTWFWISCGMLLCNRQFD